MYSNYVELSIEGLTRGKEWRKAFLLMLRQKDGSALLPLLVPEEGYKRVMKAVHGGDYTSTELMNRLARRVGMRLLGGRVMQPLNGTSQALLDFGLINEVVSLAVPVVDAVVAAMEMNVSLWMEKGMFENMTRFMKEENAVALPMGGISNEMLSDFMQTAAGEDNFELASMLRDELARRRAADDGRTAGMKE